MRGKLTMTCGDYDSKNGKQLLQMYNLFVNNKIY